ncbi:MAG: citryl-CoA lyase [Betaproteobacteria bacterium]
MTSKQEALRSDIAWSTADKIGVHGYDLTEELMGKVNLGDMAFLEVSGRLPDGNESRMFNAILVTLVEHGIVPSTLAARMTYAGAPEAMQAAVAAGLLGLGSVFVGSTEGSARMLADAVSGMSPDEPLADVARRVVAEHRAVKRIVPGLGHPIHKPIDPRTVRLFAIAKETGFSGRYVELMQQIAAEAQAATGRTLPVNATGAIGAICCEMGFAPKIASGLGIMARAVGLVGHVLEEARAPMAMEIWHRAEDESSEHSRGKLRSKRE